jgi:peptidoglycan/LPS O-acetylase OafA/YrhL
MDLSNNLQKKQSVNYIPQLDGLRGMAILMVTCFHYFPNSTLFRFGWSGVDLFFVLSGYLITGRLLPYLSDKKIFRKFYWNRFVRIIPLYFGFLILFFAVWFLFASPQSLASYRYYHSHWWNFFLFFQNWTFILNHQISPGGLAHLWSLAVEEQFYLLLPPFLLLLRERKKILYASVFLIIVIIICRSMFFHFFLANRGHEIIYWNTFFRLDSFLTGLILFIMVENKITLLKFRLFLKYVIGISMILLFVELIILRNADAGDSFYPTTGYTVVGVMYAFLLYIILLNKNKIFNNITNNIFFRHTGKISYSIFIFHLPVYTLLLGMLNKLNIMDQLSINSNSLSIINGLLCLPFTYFLSHLSFKYYESYFLKWKIKLIANP